MNILQINASARREGAHSTRIANEIVRRLRASDPEARLVVRDLASQPHPRLDEAALIALGLNEISFIYAEGLNMGPDSAARGFAQAEADLEAAFA
jgi:FMN-dependent NADH-azoreductase